MNKYEYATREEINWLNEDIRTTKEMLENKMMEEPKKTEMKLRLLYTQNEMSRLNSYMTDYEEREIEELKHFLIEHGCMSEERLNEFIEFFKKSKGD